MMESVWLAAAGLCKAPSVYQSRATAEIFKFPGIWSASLPRHHLLGLEIAQLESEP